VFGGRFAGWGFWGREDKQGPQALGGTWYEFPPAGPEGGCGPGHWGQDLGGSWFWMRSPEQEKVVVASLFSRYCIRCHGADGRGQWDIPGIPNFTNQRWQNTRTDDQIARIVIEGRGAVMPAFRGALTLEEAFAMARYLRSFAPGMDMPRPDFDGKEKSTPKSELPVPKEVK
jgi:hypothetical protein